ncbi:ATP-dependent DNA helicase [Carbonactinospora thermoautotrophica]|uniref:Probable DNA 3'-5' helicase RecG n=2 Tax=Carbonactinospora thermoautotrophica TaxID=1469144 RepID=A0A132N1V5_9ACTN|nr:helicase-related protein [Carbonactinospora thermoautotrophica]KWX03986.1 ATP-dependent DNA helicase [Carbonactinospora thermoautotrophica]
MTDLSEPLTRLVGDRTAKVLRDGLGLRTVGDLLRHYPRRYAERGELTNLDELAVDEHVTVMAEIARVTNRKMRNRRGSILEVVVTDGRGQLTLTFFNQAWRERQLRPGRRGLFSGKVTLFRGKRQLAHPDYMLVDDDTEESAAEAFANEIIPVYPASAAIPSWKIAQCVRIALDTLGPVEDPLPKDIRERRGLLELRAALEKIHRPRSHADIAAARLRLKWDEAFVLQVALARRRAAFRRMPAVPRIARPDGLVAAFEERLPFQLTRGQREVCAAITRDLAQEHPMHRLLQGEVGSGKAQPLDALVLTPAGFRRMGDIRVGDQVITPSGEITVVTGVFPQGEREVWRVVLSDDSAVECDLDHLWAVNTAARRDRGEPWMVLSLRQIKDDLRTAAGTPKWHLPTIQAPELDCGAERPLDPYVLGVLLGAGDGTADPELGEVVREHLAGTCHARERAGGYAVVDGRRGCDSLTGALRDLGGRTPRERFVPPAYLVAPVKVRHAVLQGLLDAGGTIDGEACILDFQSASVRLARDVRWLAQSLGGWARHRPVRENGDVYHRVTLRLPLGFAPSRLASRVAEGRHQRVTCDRTIRAVEHVGRKPVQCITVAHPEQLYVTDHFVPTHNTVVALRAMLTVVDAGGQAALLAPTEVLAQQHHRSIVELLGPLAQGGMLGGDECGTKVALLTGSQTARERKQALLDVASGEAGIVVGTHALLQDPVQFFDLGLVVIDEQHRFGVEQRDVLRSKAGQPPHVLVMTATPIPRTVAMTVFGDLEVSTLTELPAGRSPIATYVVPAVEKPQYLERTWARIREEIAAGHQAYVVCPRIGDEEGTEEDALEGAPRDDRTGAGRRPPLAVLDVAPMLAEGPLRGLRLGVLHGRLPPDEKDEVMRAFAAGEIDVLVATTVVEVGVDVPNATVMVVMDADRFGVSQLHQLRGRVGRGKAPGLCLLVTEAAPGTGARARLDAVAATLDGFELSRIDLEQRREGDVLGAAQSGRRSSLRMLAVIRDENVIREARGEATALVEADPDLNHHPEVRAALDELLDEERVEYLDKA